jgi:hypothetical protein
VANWCVPLKGGTSVSTLTVGPKRSMASNCQALSKKGRDSPTACEPNRSTAWWASHEERRNRRGQLRAIDGRLEHDHPRNPLITGDQRSVASALRPTRNDDPRPFRVIVLQIS